MGCTVPGHTCYNWCDCNGRPMMAGRVSASGTCEHPFMRITWGHPQWPGSGCIVLRGSLHIDTLSRIMCWALANLGQGMIHSATNCCGSCLSARTWFICLGICGEHRPSRTSSEHAGGLGTHLQGPHFSLSHSICHSVPPPHQSTQSHSHSPTHPPANPSIYLHLQHA